MTRNVRFDQKPAPSPSSKSKVKTADKQHEAMQRYLRE
jgi:hypothetical protein